MAETLLRARGDLRGQPLPPPARRRTAPCGHRHGAASAGAERGRRGLQGRRLHPPSQNRCSIEKQPLSKAGCAIQPQQRAAEGREKSSVPRERRE